MPTSKRRLTSIRVATVRAAHVVKQQHVPGLPVEPDGFCVVRVANCSGGFVVDFSPVTEQAVAGHLVRRKVPAKCCKKIGRVARDMNGVDVIEPQQLGLNMADDSGTNGSCAEAPGAYPLCRDAFGAATRSTIDWSLVLKTSCHGREEPRPKVFRYITPRRSNDSRMIGSIRS